MKEINSGGDFSQTGIISFIRTWLVTGLLFGLLANPARAFVPIEPYATNFYVPLNSWSFSDTNFWSSDQGNFPTSFTNLSASELGNPTALVVNSTSPAWLNFPVVNTNGTTNLTVEIGTAIFWYAPTWASMSQGGNGPDERGGAHLLEVGGYTPNSSFGLWSLYVDDAGSNLCFSAQTNDFSGNFCTYVTAPIAWTSNYWHFVAFTYSATNTALYVDGVLATNGPPITNCPGPPALANGMFIGSSSNGLNQAEGMLDDLDTYNVPLDANTIHDIFTYNAIDYYGNPLNAANLRSAGSNPSTNADAPDVITGAGYLQWVATAAFCSTNINPYVVWITNITASAVGNGVVNVQFTIAGGADGFLYDVFANSVLSFGPAGVPWSWMGQGPACTEYSLLITNTASVFLILGTPQDSSGADLTDAYQLLVSKTNPGVPDADVDGLPTGWEVLLGLNPGTSNPAQANLRANYGYTPADWLDGVTGIKSDASITSDAEGNVGSVSQ